MPTNFFWGATFAVLAALSFALWNIYLQRALAKGGGPRLSLLSLSLTVAVTFAPVALWLGLRGELPPVSRAGLGWFVAAGLMTAAVGPLLATHATRHIGAGRTVALRLLDPLFALLIATLFLNESVRLQVIVGIAVIVAALSLLQADARRGAAAPSAGQASTIPAGRGIAFGVAASLLFTLGSVSRKTGLLLMPSAAISGLCEGLTGLLVILPTFVTPAGRLALRQAFRRESLDFWLSGLGGAGGTLFLNLALQRVPLPVAVTLRNTSPWFSLLLLPLLLGRQHKPGRLVWGSTALLTVGMLLIVLR